MKGEAIRTAVAIHLSAELGAQLELGEEVEDSALPAVFAPLFGQAAIEMPLIGVTVVRADGDWLHLTPEEAEAHPLVAGHVAPTFGEAVAVVVIAGARMFDAAPGAPHWSDFRSTELSDGRRQGLAQMHFGPAHEITVRAYYGTDARASTALMVTHQVLGSALLHVGREARRVSAASATAPPGRAQPADEAEDAPRRLVH